MDAFEKPYWSRLQAELWICTRSPEAVRLADQGPGKTRLVDLNLGADGWDDEADYAKDADDGSRGFASEEELIGVAIANYGSVCQFEHARMEIGFACQDRRLHVYLKDGRAFFRTEEVLALAEAWPASASSREPTAVERKSPFPRAKFPDLLNFLRDCPEIMTRSKQKEAARQHFPNHHLPESLFREVFRQDPRQPGRHPKS